MLLPTVCPPCGRPCPAPCAACRLAVRSPGPAPAPPGVDSLVVLMAYTGVGREIVARLKYRNARSAVAWLADGMAALVDPGAFDVVTWVPTSAARRRQRGFDQARLLATALSRRLHRPCRRLLMRRPGPPQTGLSRAERLGAPLLVPRPGPLARRVLLVDDVVTTGSTLAAGAVALRSAGAGEVHAVAAAHRPIGGRRPAPAHAAALKGQCPSSDALGT